MCGLELTTNSSGSAGKHAASPCMLPQCVLGCKVAVRLLPPLAGWGQAGGIWSLAV